VATVWLDGCSGCHMSFLDMDERLIELAQIVDVVYSPIVDTKEFPTRWISRWSRARGLGGRREEDQEDSRHTKLLIAMGDCAITAMYPRCATHRPGGHSRPRVH